jgi:hypothetical protein
MIELTILLYLFQDPGIHIDGSISIGSILTTVTLLGIAGAFHKDWVEFKYEHRMMYAHYCQVMGIELPAKHKKALQKLNG